jgi:hypothetical protein
LVIGGYWLVEEVPAMLSLTNHQPPATNHPPRRPEQELLLCCARARLEPHHCDRIAELLDTDLDWDFLSQQATDHAVLPLVYQHLRDTAAPRCPQRVLQAWHANALAVHLAGLRLSAELLTLVDLFRQEGIAVLGFKGPVAALALYGNLGLRPCVDLDLLVPPVHVAATCALLVRQGYAPDAWLSPDWEKVLFRLRSERMFHRQETAGLIDLHWGLLPPGYSFTPATEGLWQRQQTVAFGQALVPTLGPEDTLVFFCLHGAKHGWEQLNWLCDLAELLRARPCLDWEGILSWAHGHGAGRLLQTGLHLAHRLLEAPVPPEVLARGRQDRRVAALVEQAATSLLFPDPAAGTRRPWPWQTFFYKAMERARDRRRCIHVTMIEPGPPDWRVLPLPAVCAPLYYAIRPIRVLLRALTGRRR